MDMSCVSILDFSLGVDQSYRQRVSEEVKTLNGAKTIFKIKKGKERITVLGLRGIKSNWYSWIFRHFFCPIKDWQDSLVQIELPHGPKKNRQESFVALQGIRKQNSEIACVNQFISGGEIFSSDAVGTRACSENESPFSFPILGLAKSRLRHH